ncbi:hypothetical protein AWM79_20885 [Pseudomonas agarici]|uniref:Uncharacterized protein n=1 Tax=Pseudomonas agarici TaxID=46677 RepID=A0A0X1T6K3_PSEAA|nr:hypothetical protein AWM79_20885 [Pseudomonas agarici]SEK83145.1 hypothetical protein SAMN05216604_10763 [Pseudomonas agarici]
MSSPLRPLVKGSGVVPTYIVKLRFWRQLNELPDRVPNRFVSRPINDFCIRTQQQVFAGLLTAKG